MEDGTLWALLGGAALFASGLVTEAVRSWLSEGAAKREREDQRKADRKDRRDAFELQTLLEVQDVIQSLLRQAGQVDFHTEIHYRATGKWVRDAPPLPDDVGGEGSLNAGNQLLKLMARVLDPNIKTSLREFNGLRAGVGIRLGAASDEEARDWSKGQMDALHDKFVDLQDQIGERIRDLHEP
jgi:hypothetical protein